MEDVGEAPMGAPKVFRFSDVDQFRSWIRELNVDFTPFVRKIAAEQTILGLPGCDVNLIKSFPRIIDAQLAPDCTAIGFTLVDHEVPIRFNGVPTDRSVIVIGAGGALYASVEEVERQYASIIFRPEVTDRGWPETQVNFKIFETSDLAIHRLRVVVQELVTVAAEPVDAAAAFTRATAMRETLLLAIDAAFAEVHSTRWSTRANHEHHFKVFQDIRELVSGDLSQPIYSEELARRVGVSVRTLHDAVRRYRGMSLHRYLRLRRLWLVRKRLLSGPGSVKAVALAFGFWHLSDFSRSYRAQFGETPSATLAQGRKT